MLRSVLRGFTAIFFIAAGANHFRLAKMYEQIIPPSLGHASALVSISGVFEMMGGIGLLIPQLRQSASWGLILLLIAVFPANIFMAMHADRFAQIPKWVLCIRLPLQPMLMIWVWWVSQSPRSAA